MGQLGELLKQQIEKSGMTDAAAARAMRSNPELDNPTARTVIRWKGGGKPGTRNFAGIARFLGLTIEDVKRLVAADHPEKTRDRLSPAMYARLNLLAADWKKSVDDTLAELLSHAPSRNPPSFVRSPLPRAGDSETAPESGPSRPGLPLRRGQRSK